MANRMTDTGSLGTYLKDRRARLDPTAFGFALTRRRTPGLRREEVAQRANVSATWYTWLGQGRGVGRCAGPHRPRHDADRCGARASVSAGPGPAAGGALSRTRRHHAAPAA